MDKKGSYKEKADKSGGTLSYTVTAEVTHGEVNNAQINDTITPPNASWFTLIRRDGNLK